MLASIVIDGEKLKAAREAKGLSIVEIATSLTLSREQVKCIEDGGDKPFYTPAHKLLAVRKYAKGLDIPYDDVVTGEGADLTLAAPEDAPPAMHVHVDSQPAAANDLRLAAVSRNAEIRRQSMIAGVILCVLLAIYAKVRGSDDEVKPEEAGTEAVGMAVYDNKSEPAAILKTDNKLAEPPAVATAVVAASTNADDENCPQEQPGTDLKSWTPAYQRKSDARLYVVSPHGGSLCITDVSGNAKRFTLEAKVGQVIPGKPPYTVRSAQLPQIEIYFQGLRVKVPTETNALRLLPTHNTSPQPVEQSRSGAPDA